MFNMTLGIIVMSLCIPGIWLMTKHTTKTLLENPENKLSKEKLTIDHLGSDIHYRHVVCSD